MKWIDGLAGILGGQPNMSIEEIECDLDHLNSPEQIKLMEDWLESRPKKVRELYKKFPNNQLYRVKEGAPYKHTCSGCVVSMYSFVENGDDLELKLRVLQSPIGTAGVIATIDPQWLEPIELEELKQETRKE